MLRHLLAFVAVLALAHPAHALQSVAQPQTWVTDGTVDAVIQSGNTLYAGGLFSNVGTYIGNGNSFAAESGAIDATFPKFDGIVTCSISDGAGGLYVGGGFLHVGGASHPSLVHIKADKTIDSAFAPNIGGGVNCMVLTGNKLFVGGNFFSIDGVVQIGVGLINATTGVSTPFGSLNGGGTVNALATDGTTLFCGGAFSGVTNSAGNDMQTRNRACSFDIATGNINAFDPNTNGNVFALVLSGTTLYMGGQFSNVNGGAANGTVVGVNTTTGTAGSFAASPGTVLALLLSGTTLYVGGRFTHNLLAYDVNTNLSTGFDPNFNNSVTAMALSGTTLYVTGSFTGVNLPVVTRNRAAAVNITTGTVLPFDPNLGSQSGNFGAILNYAPGAVFVGGPYTSYKTVARRNIAAFDATTGIVTAFDANCDAEVLSLATNGTNIYAGGKFSSINGGAVLRTSLAAFDPATGVVNSSFNANLTSSGVNAILLSGNTLYAGGNLGFQTHNFLAAFDATSGVVSSWDPGVSGTVNALALSGTTLYFGGNFTAVNGGATPRGNIAAVSTTTGTATAFDPSVNAPVNSLLISGSTVYAGGSFNSVNTSTASAMRVFCAAFDAASGTVTAFNTNSVFFPIQKVKAMTLLGSSLLLGGDFNFIGTQTGSAFAAVDPTTGATNPLYIDVGEGFGAPINSFLLTNTTLYLGGGFAGGLDDNGHPFLAAFSLNDPTITAVSPTVAAAGGAAFTLTITGTNFNSRSVVNWNGSPRATNVVNVATLTAVISATDIATAGSANVTVFTTGSPTTAALPLTIGNAPSITSPLTATLTAGTPYSYTLTASGDAPVSLNATGLAPGLVYVAPTIMGRVTAVGTFTIALGASNTFGSDAKTLTITANAPILSADEISTEDTDGDGFSNELELALGSNPYDPSATPINNNPAVTAALTAKLSVKLDFKNTGNDRLSLSGTLPVPTGFNIAGQSVIVNIGGIIRTIALDAKKSLFKLGKPSTKTGLAKFALTLIKDRFQASLADEGLSNTTQTDSVVKIPTQVLLNGTLYSKSSNLLYNATMGKSGATK